MKHHYKKQLGKKELRLIERVNKQYKQGEKMGFVKKTLKTTGIILLSLYTLDKCSNVEEKVTQEIIQPSTIELTITKTFQDDNKLSEQFARNSIREMGNYLPKETRIYSNPQHYI